MGPQECVGTGARRDQNVPHTRSQKSHTSYQHTEMFSKDLMELFINVLISIYLIANVIRNDIIIQRCCDLELIAQDGVTSRSIGNNRLQHSSVRIQRMNDVNAQRVQVQNLAIELTKHRLVQACLGLSRIQLSIYITARTNSQENSKRPVSNKEYQRNIDSEAIKPVPTCRCTNVAVEVHLERMI